MTLSVLAPAHPPQASPPRPRRDHADRRGLADHREISMVSQSVEPSSGGKGTSSAGSSRPGSKHPSAVRAARTIRVGRGRGRDAASHGRRSLRLRACCRARLAGQAHARAGAAADRGRASGVRRTATQAVPAQRYGLRDGFRVLTRAPNRPWAFHRHKAVFRARLSDETDQAVSKKLLSANVNRDLESLLAG